MAAPERTPQRTLVVDFDGTITERDLLDEIARRFGDPAVYREVENGLDDGTMPLRDVITREFAPVKRPLEEVGEWTLAHVRIRAGFRELVELARVRGWGFEVVSSGFRELIEPVLEREGVQVDLHANRVEATPDGWRVLWSYGDDCGSCGESCKRALAAELVGVGELVYVGDGYSDRCAAELADRVFARRGLAAYLDGRGVAYERFDDFHDVIRGLDGGR